jgi:hypothetical protein
MTCFLNSNGDMFTCGWRTKGLNEMENFYPEKVEKLFSNAKGVTDISCGN